MKKILLILFALTQSFFAFTQGRNINKLTLETTYSYVEIHKSLRDLIDEVKRENYFNDDFFNTMLKKILVEKKFSNKEKVQLFYLMQKKLGYAFVGANYLPPKQSYFIFHLSKMLVLQQTQDALKELKMSPQTFIDIAESHKTNDPIIASNAMLLATLINPAEVTTKLHDYSKSENILASKNPVIYNHYLCLSAALVQDSTITSHLKKNIFTFKQESMIEDGLCALYSKPNAVSTIKQYILQEKNAENDLAIQTALCALYTKVSEQAFKQSTYSMSEQVQESWKKTLLSNISQGKINYNYSLTSSDILVCKPWDYVQISVYNDGTLISNNTLLEFDPN